MKRKKHKIIFRITKKVIALLSTIVNESNHTKCISVSNQKHVIQPSLINLYPNKCSWEFHYYPFAVKLNTCVGSCNSLNDLFNKTNVPNKTEDLI